MLEKVTGFIVCSVDYRETSLILKVFTKEHGLISVMGKGVKSLKSPLRALTFPYTYGYFYLYYKEDKISILKDVDIIDPLFKIHEDLTLLSYVNYFDDFVSQVYKESHSPYLFGLLQAVILKTNEGFDPAVLSSILEVKCLPMLGVGLSLDACINCGSQKEIVTIDADQGGLLCKKCYRNEKRYHPETIKLLRLFQYVDIAKITKVNIKKDIKKEIELFLLTYYSRYTGIYFQSKEFLKKIKPL